MNDRRRARLFKLGTAAIALAFTLIALGFGYGQGCDVDTMNVCRPFDMWTGGSFLVQGIAGLLLVAGLGLGALGGLLILVGLWRYRRQNTRSKA